MNQFELILRCAEIEPFEKDLKIIHRFGISDMFLFEGTVHEFIKKQFEEMALRTIHYIRSGEIKIK